MVVKIMKWMPWPPLISKRYEVKLAVQRLEVAEKDFNGGFAVEIRWKGGKLALASLRRTVKRNCTREEVGKRVHPGNGAVLVEWNEQFQSVCSLSGYKDNAFHPWEISFNVLHVPNQGAKNKFSVVASANLNLAEYATKIDAQVVEIKIPLIVSSNVVEPRPLLFISLNLVELIEPREMVQSPIASPQIPSASGETCSNEKDEVSALKASLKKVKIFTDYVSTRKAKKACEEDGKYTYPFDSESLEETEEAESDEVDEDSAIRKSFSYGTLASTNYAGVLRYSGAKANNEGGNWTYYSNVRRSDVAILEQSTMLNSRRSILPWRKRKMHFRSPKVKGEPLLKKAYAEEGGDDIDFDRRQLGSDESVSIGLHGAGEDSSTNHSSASEFDDDSFVIGTWEQKEITSRDGRMKIHMQVFFASIDQRNETAAGESACTALVAVIADWLQNNRNVMPVKSQFDSLIRDGSLEWRNLCENETYKEHFPDKHFDLETVIHAKIRDICIVLEKSFIGFFRMEEGNFDFLNGAMSFDTIWDEITNSGNGECPVFIVSWNDHFFALKVESDAYYIIDTLGERLHEGCNQAYILKFDWNTTIYKLPDQSLEESGEVVCRGKEACKEYIKSFLAAIPIRELQMDIKKGLPISKPLHHRLQIEFHFTQLQPSSPPTETVILKPKVVDVTA